MITCTVSEMRFEAIEKLTSMGLMKHAVHLLGQDSISLIHENRNFACRLNTKMVEELSEGK